MPNFYPQHQRSACAKPPPAQPASRRGRSARFCTALLFAAATIVAQAAAPVPFEARYDASYDGYSAQATRSLSQDSASEQFVLQSRLELVLLGSVVASITESSEFLWVSDRPLPQQYKYVQQGIGARERSISFDHAQGEALYSVNGTTGSLMLTDAIFDELSGNLLLEARLEAGEMDVSFDVVDRDEIETIRYKVRNKERVTTRLGEFDTVKLERIRDTGSSRSTEIWLAPAHNYLLVKLVQTEPNGRIIRLDIREASIAGQALNTATADSP